MMETDADAVPTYLDEPTIADIPSTIPGAAEPSKLPVAAQQLDEFGFPVPPEKIAL